MKSDELSVAWNPHTGVVEGQRLGQPVTLDELIAATGLHPDEVEVVDSSYANMESRAWPTSMKLEKRDDDGKIIESAPVQVWNHLSWVKLRIKTDERLARQVTDSLLEDIRAEKAGEHDPVPPPPDPGDEGVVVELDIFDPHFQMLAWGQETGQDQDLAIISTKYRSAAADLKEQALKLGYPVVRWVLVVGQDLFHTDVYIDGKGGATAAGTVQDVDTRKQKAARVVRTLLTDLVLDLLGVAAVDILVVPGNHDTESSWWMGEILDARFHGNPNVRVDNRPMLRKYYRIGNSLLGFSHGHKLKAKDLRDYMSQEAKQDWSETVFREWHLGHIHHEVVKDERGVLVRYMPSIAGTDAWHYSKGFVHSQRGARGIVWSKTHGPRQILQHNIPITEEELARTAPMLRGDRG